MCYTIAACFPFEPLEKCMTFNDIFTGLSALISRDQSDFPGLSTRRGNPAMPDWHCTADFIVNSSLSFFQYISCFYCQKVDGISRSLLMQPKNMPL